MKMIFSIEFIRNLVVRTIGHSKKRSKGAIKYLKGFNMQPFLIHSTAFKHIKLLSILIMYTCKDVDVEERIYRM